MDICFTRDVMGSELAVFRTRVGLATMHYAWTRSRLRDSPVPHVVASETRLLGELLRRRLAGESVEDKLKEQSERFVNYWAPAHAMRAV